MLLLICYHLLVVFRAYGSFCGVFVIPMFMSLLFARLTLHFLFPSIKSSISHFKLTMFFRRAFICVLWFFTCLFCFSFFRIILFIAQTLNAFFVEQEGQVCGHPPLQIQDSPELGAAGSLKFHTTHLGQARVGAGAGWISVGRFTLSIYIALQWANGP